ncbi:MAG: hypothetical protein RR128_09885, partial [Clostridium sp.]
MKKQWRIPEIKNCSFSQTNDIIPETAKCKERPNAGPNRNGRCRNPSKFPDCTHRRIHAELPGTDADCDLIRDGSEPIS